MFTACDGQANGLIWTRNSSKNFLLNLCSLFHSRCTPIVVACLQPSVSLSLPVVGLFSSLQLRCRTVTTDLQYVSWRQVANNRKRYNKNLPNMMSLETCRYDLISAISAVLGDSQLDRFVLVSLIPEVQKLVHRYQSSSSSGARSSNYII